jgi:ATP-dependent exoDNAse (exonuclease V) beta subunit
MEAFSGSATAPSGLELALNMEESFQQGNIGEVIENLNILFQSVPYQLASPATEKFFHAAIHLIFTQLGLRIHSEVCTSNGRIDSVIETRNTIYILEFKLDQSAEKALDQIKKKEYFQPYKLLSKKIIGIGIQLNSSTRKIENWREEDM